MSKQPKLLAKSTSRQLSCTDCSTKTSVGDSTVAVVCGPCTQKRLTSYRNPRAYDSMEDPSEELSETETEEEDN